jgi:hypothetical protein
VKFELPSETTRFKKAKFINFFVIEGGEMKRFWLVLLSLGLIMAFSASAFAVDVKVSGEYYVAGMYLNKTNLADQNTNPSTAFYFQRLRVGTDFIVSPSLKLVTRFDAMERIWGGARSAVGTTLAADSAGTRAEDENIAFDWAYIDYQSPIGIFKVGYMEYGATGTVFGNSTYPAGRIRYYSYPIQGSININADISKIKDQSSSAVTSATWTDLDNDVYGIEGTYKWNDGKAGMKINYYRYAEKRLTPDNYKKTYFLFTPYTIAKIGPVNLQAELNYATGNLKQYDTTSPSDVKLENISGWIDATANLGMTYVGGTVAYVSGDDPGTPDKQEGGTLNGGTDWNPCLILFNYYDRTYWVGALAGNDTSTNSGPMSNAWFFQGRAGVKPIPQLDAMLSVSYAKADKKPTGFTGGSYGWEVDVTGTYKITNNLSYMLGIGYLFTGDYYKGVNAGGTNEVVDDYMLINKLTLTF